MDHHEESSTSPIEPPAQRRMSRFLQIVALLVVVLLVFSAGLFVGGVAEPAESPTDSAEAAQTATVPAPIAESWALIQERYVDEAAIDDDAMIEAAIRGMLGTLGDEGHTRYLTPDQAVMHEQGLSGSIVGIGVQVELRDGDIVVVAPIDGSPAAEAGVRSGDILVEVDGRAVSDVPLEEVVSWIRGEEGTTVDVTFVRPADDSRFTLTLERARIDVQTVTWTILPDGQALIRIRQFANGATSQLVAALEQIQDAGVEGIVLDVRNNPGGYVHEAIGVASQLMPEGTPVFIARSREDGSQVHRTEAGLALTEIPMVVLINQGSASAAEIVAGALQENGRATLVGETTFGTGTVLGQFGLSDGSVILLGTQLWLTPDGDLIRGQGIDPDVRVVAMPDDTLFVATGRSGTPPTEEQIEQDPQLDRALSILRGQPVSLMSTGAPCPECG